MKKIQATKTSTVNPAELANALKIKSSVRGGLLSVGVGGGTGCIRCGILLQPIAR